MQYLLNCNGTFYLVFSFFTDKAHGIETSFKAIEGYMYMPNKGSTKVLNDMRQI